MSPDILFSDRFDESGDIYIVQPQCSIHSLPAFSSTYGKYIRDFWIKGY